MLRLATLGRASRIQNNAIDLKTSVFFVVCVMAGFTLNLFPIPLFNDLTLLVGPAFSLLIALTLGPYAGAIAAALISMALVISWQHWVGVLLFIPEAFVVGWLFRKGWNELLAVTLYWLGISIIFSALMFVNGLSFMILDVTAKYLINAFLYTLLASAVVWFFSISSRLKLSNLREYSLRTQIFMILMVSMVLPIAALMLVNANQMHEELEKRLDERLLSRAVQSSRQLTSFLKVNEIVIAKHAEVLAYMPENERFSNKNLEQTRKLNPDFLSLFVANKAGQVEGFSPENRLVEELPSIKDRAYFSASIGGSRYTSKVFKGRAKGLKPIIVISAPIIAPKTQSIEGILGGSLDLAKITDLMQKKKVRLSRTERVGLNVLITDSTHRVIYASDSLGYSALDAVPWLSAITPKTTVINNSEDSLLNGMRIRTLSMNNGWKVTTSILKNEYDQVVKKRYRRLALTLLAVILIVGMLAAFISNQVSGPLVWLLRRTVSLDLATDIQQRPATLSPYLPSEMVKLVRAYESAERRLKIAFETEKMHQLKRIDAEKASHEKSFFVSSMSHELRTPLNAIFGFCQLLQVDETLKPETKSLANEIYIASQHLMLLINDILDLSKIESGKLELKLQDFDITPLVNECLTMIAANAKERNISIEFVLNDGEKIVRADRLKLKQVLINLLNNAIKYNTENGKVEIVLSQESKEKTAFWRVLIEDTGEGIPPSQLSQLFQPFERLTQENQMIDGYGIGLAVSQKLTKAMRGEILVDSELGKGSRFSVLMPAAETALVASSATKEPEEKEKLQQCRILYIEDNEVNALVMRRALEKYSAIELVRESCGESGLKRLENDFFDFVFLDITLPDMTGYEVLFKMQSNFKQAYHYVFAVSANALSDDIKRGKAAGFDEYITKPVRFESLVKEIIKYQQMN